jgi:hypothetical protein
MATIEALHGAMGEFLTESSHVENTMLGFVISSRSGRSIEDVFVDFMGKTFGDKIKWFKQVCNANKFTDEQRETLDNAYNDLDILLRKRNFIVHGTTYQIGKENIPVQWYRIGMTRGDYDHMNDAITQNFDVPHVFTVERISAATRECVALRAKLMCVLLEVIQDRLVNRAAPQPEPS